MYWSRRGQGELETCAERGERSQARGFPLHLTKSNTPQAPSHLTRARAPTRLTAHGPAHDADHFPVSRSMEMPRRWVLASPVAVFSTQLPVSEARCVGG